MPLLRVISLAIVPAETKTAFRLPSDPTRRSAAALSGHGHGHAPELHHLAPDQHATPPAPKWSGKHGKRSTRYSSPSQQVKRSTLVAGGLARCSPGLPGKPGSCLPFQDIGGVLYVRMWRFARRPRRFGETG
ncbi:hypothetical protein EV126DRAFT_97766 [Verticillium dahliae]|nr:hypothetical protein EV126DRAFT_97766 [Verticillium dahliae]